jgi:hypothetical protein
MTACRQIMDKFSTFHTAHHYHGNISQKHVIFTPKRDNAFILSFSECGEWSQPNDEFIVNDKQRLQYLVQTIKLTAAFFTEFGKI